MNVIIADDEKRVANLIKNLCDWESLGLEVKALCFDGESALEAILTHQPEIVITDIRMPKLDGLQLVQQTRERGLNCSFIIISGYKHFEYARQALQYGVADYLLKPIDEEQLTATLRKLTAIIQNRDRNARLVTEASRQTSQRQDAAFWSALLSGGESIDWSAEAVERAYGKRFAPGSFLALAVRVDNLALLSEDGMFFEKLSEIAAKTIPSAQTRLAHNDHLCCYFLLSFPQQAQTAVCKEIKSFYFRTSELQEIYGSLSLTMGVGEPVHCLEAVASRGLPQAIRAADARLSFGAGRLYNAAGLHFTPMPVEQLLTLEYVRGLKTAIGCLEVEQLHREKQRLLEACQGKDGADPADILRLCGGLLQCCEDTLSRESFDRLDAAAQRAIAAARSFSDLIEAIFRCMEQAIEELLTERLNGEIKPVRQTKQYIAAHFAEGLTLEIVAAHIGINPSYLSRLFKQHTGEGFNEYVVSVRIEQSKHLLRTTRMNLQTIAENVGYYDPKYFARLFKKTVGITPSEFRKLYD